MADRGFTVQDILKEKGVSMNIPPFLNGRTQLPEEELQHGRHIASLRIHVERAIGRIKNYGILSGVFPLTMIRLANHIVSGLTNFQPVLVPPPTDSYCDDEIDSYFKAVLESDDSDYDGDTELTDDEQD